MECGFSEFSYNVLIFVSFDDSSLFYIGVELINNVSLVSGVQQSDSVIHIHVSILFQFFSPFRYYRVFSRVPCAIQQVLVGYLFYT